MLDSRPGHIGSGPLNAAERYIQFKHRQALKLDGMADAFSELSAQDRAKVEANDVTEAEVPAAKPIKGARK